MKFSNKSKNEGKTTKFKGLNKKGKIIVGIIIAIIVLVAITLVTIGVMDKPVDSSSNQVVTVTIETGSSTTDIGQELFDNGLIKSVTSFKIISKLKGYDGKYLAGSYSLSPSMSTTEMIKAIVDGDTVSISFTVVPGETTEDIAKKLEENGIVTYDSFMNEVKNGSFDYDFMKYLPSGKYRMEGVLYPDTYSLEVGANAHEILDAMLSLFNNNIDKSFYSKAKKLGYSFYDVLKVASIVEREAAKEDERAKVASVVYNRLDKGMALQMCSTLSFILDDGRVNLTNSDLQIDSPYNTYKYQGLTPTPIGNPGIGSIEAALNPADTEYLYFVLSDKLDGSSNFSSDYDKFLKDKDAYYEAYNKEHGDE